MVIRCSFIILFVLFLVQAARANFDFNANCVKAYQNILSLKLNNARLSRMEKDDRNSPYYLFAQAEINLQWALTRGRFQEYFSSALEINRAYNQLQENSGKFPAFLPNQINLGMINAIMGSLPDGLKKAMSAFGIRGDTRSGLRMLENLILKLPQSPYPHFYEEAVFYLSYIQTDIINDPANYNRILANTRDINPESLLRTYLRAYAGIRMGYNKDAIIELAKRPAGAEYQPYPYLDYLMGIAKMHTLDQAASSNLLNYLKNYRGVNYIKDAYLNLAWLELLKGNIKGYRSFTDQLKSKGFTYHEKKKDKPKAGQYYNTAISMKGHDYENSIENKAKEGLKRLSTE